MNLDFKQHLPDDFSENSRVWIYQSSRLFSISEALQLEAMFENFVNNWNSHGAPVKGYANLFFGRFIILMADEKTTGVSGCSTDSSVRLIKSIEQEFSVDMLNRQMLGLLVKDKIEIIPLTQLSHALQNNFINEKTLYFNNLALTKKELENNWIIPLENSWLASKIKKEIQ